MKDCGNIYRFARVTARISQEVAAELLYTSTRSLSDYESGRTTPPDDIVCAMVEVYSASWLAYEHLRVSSKVGQMFLPAIEYSDLPKAVLRFQKEVGDIQLVSRDMVEIACDGAVEQHEEERWHNIGREVKEAIAAAFSVVFAHHQEKEKSPKQFA